MKNKLDLNSYLERYGQQVAADTDFQPSQSRSKRFNQSFEKVTYQPNTKTQPQPFYQTPTTYSGFNKAQNQCIQQLHEVKRSLLNEEKQMSFFLENYSKKVYDNLLIEHNRIREQVLDLLDKSFAESERRISSIIAQQSGNQPLEFQNIRKKINQINIRIDQLDRMLKGDNYRKAIAEVVTSDFQEQIRIIDSHIANSEKTILENATKLIIDEGAFNRLRQDIQNLVKTESKRDNISNNQLGLGNSGVRKNRLGLFEAGSQPKHSQTQKGFFNFNNN